MGYDSHEDITFEVAKHSIETRSSVPVDIFFYHLRVRATA